MRRILSLLTAGVALIAVAAHGAEGDRAATTQAQLDRIGEWDGVTETAELSGPYEDVVQQDIPFGRHSYFLTPWRAYMDTWPAARYLECLGVNFTVNNQEAPATARILEEAGVRSARVELGWGGMSFDDPSSMSDDRKKSCGDTLRILQKHHIRPLILLNGHHGVPCPMKGYRTSLKENAPAGARTVVLKDARQAVPFYSGISGQTDYLAAEIIFTSVDKTTGKCELSRPLPKPIKTTQDFEVAILKFQAFSGKVFADGKPNPASQETFDGWMAYVKGITQMAKEALGTEGKEDAGFDLEVWNEYTFGSHFLDINNYYDPPLKFKEPFKYSAHGRTQNGVEAILPMTVDYVNDPANKLPGVGVLSGFANQRPWENGTEMWPGQMGFSRHYYAGINLDPITPASAPYQQIGPLNALGKVDGKVDGKQWHTVVPGSYFIPTLIVAMPERNFYAYQTEFMVRDIEPFPGPWSTHHRYSNPGTGKYAQVWQTEYNFDRSGWCNALMKKQGLKSDDPKLLHLVQQVAAKATLRTFVFQSHKGIYTVDLFAVKQGDTSLGIVNDEFFKTLAAEKYELTEKSRSQAGPQIAVMKRMTDLMKTGEAVDVPRKITLAKLVEHHPRLVFAGDGSPEHPDRFNRDDFACLPYQLAADKFAIAYYVVTRNMVHEWNKDKDVLDPARYDMPEQTFDLTLANLRGDGVEVEVYDPMTDKTLRAQKLAGTANSLTVRVPTVDYPRMLIVHESQAGPMILRPKLEQTEEGPGVVFGTNEAVAAKVTWGHSPHGAGRER